jgi:TRAP-type C4-dicarboxylate transport system permease small subunit
MQQSSFTKDLKLSWIFFIAGSVFGIVISLILPQMHKPFLGIPSDKLAIFFQITFVSILLTQIDILTKLFKRQSLVDKEKYLS